MELMQQKRLLRFGLCIARHDQPPSVGGGEAHIQHLNRGQFFQHRSGREAGSQGGQPLSQGHRKGVGEKSHKDVSFHPLLHLMIDRTQPQFALERLEGRFNLGRLDIAFPEHRRLAH